MTIHRPVPPVAPGGGGWDLMSLAADGAAANDLVVAIHYTGPTPELDHDFYAAVRDRAGERELIDRVEVPAVTGYGFALEAGDVGRLICHEGAQIVDVMVFNREDPSERLWANQTLNREGLCLTTGSRLWGSLPMFRPLVTIVDDTVCNIETETTARHHCISGAHCNPRFWGWGLGTYDHPFAQQSNCFYNLLAAIEPFGLGRADVHDNLNLFQKIGILPTGELVMEPSDVQAGDHVDFFAELHVLVAISLCPQGSGTAPPTTVEQDPKALLVERWRSGIAPLPSNVVAV